MFAHEPVILCRHNVCTYSAFCEGESLVLLKLIIVCVCTCLCRKTKVVSVFVYVLYCTCTHIEGQVVR